MLTQHACQSVTRRFVTKAEPFNLAPSDLVLTPRPDRTLDSGLVRRPLAKAAGLLGDQPVLARFVDQSPGRDSSTANQALVAPEITTEVGGRLAT